MIGTGKPPDSFGFPNSGHMEMKYHSLEQVKSSYMTYLIP